MSRLNGVGITFLGISKQDEQGVARATKWFTLLFAPLIPLGTYEIQFLPYEGEPYVSGYSYQIIRRLPFDIVQMCKTLLFSWIVVPLVLFLPMVPAPTEVWQKLNLPEALQMPYILLSIGWVLFCVWKLADWHEQKSKG